MPKLRELDAVFLRHESKVETYQTVYGPFTGPVDYFHRVETLDEAQGIDFECPKCADGHHVMLGFTGKAPAGKFSRDENGKDTRWNATGTGLDDLSLYPSVDCTKGGGSCSWHGFIKNGSAD